MTYPVVVDLLTNNAYGDFGGRPSGSLRRVAPKVLICIHITDDLGTAQQQRDYANRAGSGGPSAHDYINPDGSVVHAIDPAYAAWSNGDVNAPKTALPIVKTVMAQVALGFNANEVYAREVECVGDGTHPVTAAQLDTIAQMLALDSKATGIPISRATVGEHSDLNTVDRPHCADLSETQLAALITSAQGADMNTIDPKKIQALGLCDLAACTVYADQGGVAAVPGLESYPGAKGIPYFGEPKAGVGASVPGKMPNGATPIVLGLGSAPYTPTICWVDFAKITPLTAPAPGTPTPTATVLAPGLYQVP